MMVVEHDMEFVGCFLWRGREGHRYGDGRVLAHGTLDEVKRDETVIESYLGR